VDVVPTFTTSNDRMCLLLSSGRYGLMRIEDAERLQVCWWGGGCVGGLRTGGGSSSRRRTKRASRPCWIPPKPCH
jgi:hypothetical protein